MYKYGAPNLIYSLLFYIRERIDLHKYNMLSVLRHILYGGKVKYYKYKYANNTRSVVCREGSCLICKHCNSVFWDYSNGPYMAFCEYDLDMELCNTFELVEECEEVNQ